jgi:hypothetical protein
VLRWHEQQQANCSQEQLQQLLPTVRMRHCSQLYINTFMTQCPLICSCFSAQELGIAAQCCTAESYKTLQQVRCAVLDKYPAWNAKQRPRLAMPQQIWWRLPISSLQEAFQDHLQQHGSRVNLAPHSDTVVLPGQRGLLTAVLNSRGSTAEGGELRLLGCCIGLHMELQGLKTWCCAAGEVHFHSF